MQNAMLYKYIMQYIYKWRFANAEAIFGDANHSTIAAVIHIETNSK